MNPPPLAAFSLVSTACRMAAADAAAGFNGLALDAWCVGTDLGDAEGIFPAAFGVSSMGAVLVRPDGFVAWRCVGGSTDHLGDLRNALAASLGVGPD